MKSTWFLAAQASFEHTSKVSFRWSEDGQVATMSTRGKGDVQRIPMNQFILAVKGVVASLADRCATLLPATMAAEQLTFDPSLLHDNCLSEISFLSTPDSKKIFEPLVSRLWDKLSEELFYINGDGVLNLNNAESWLQKEQVLLGDIARAINLTCGEPPRAFQLLDLRYQKFGNLTRNLYLSGGVPVIAWLKRKGQWRNHYHNSLWALPSAISWPLYLYLAVFRPIAMELLKRLKRLTPYHSSFVFVHTAKVKGQDPRWRTGEYNAVLKSTFSGLEFSLNDSMLRQLFHNILLQHLPRSYLCQRSSTFRGMQPNATSNRQSGHSHEIAEKHYGRFLSVMGFSFSEVDRCFGISQGIQAFLGVGVLDDRWREELFEMPWRLVAENRSVAIDRAHVLIARHYGVPCSPSQLSHLISSILQERPFLGAVQVSPQPLSLTF